MNYKKQLKQYVKSVESSIRHDLLEIDKYNQQIECLKKSIKINRNLICLSEQNRKNAINELNNLK